MPLAFFCTLFFRHRKKSVSAPWDGQSQFAPESARQAPPGGISYGKVVACCCKQGGFPLAPLHPLRIATRNNRAPHGTASPYPRRGEFLTAKLSFNEAMQGAFRSPPVPFGPGWRENPWPCLLAENTNGFPRGKQSARPSLSENPHRNIFPSGNPPSFPLGKPQLSPHCRTF